MSLFKFCPTTSQVSQTSPTARAESEPRVRSLVVAIAIAMVATGCSTPVLKHSVGIPAKYASATASKEELEAAWWESFGDPVLSDLIRRAARENRNVKIAAERVRAARAGETISRSWLLPSIYGVGAGVDQRTNSRFRGDGLFRDS